LAHLAIFGYSRVRQASTKSGSCCHARHSGLR
jgi:hypothetical protein